MQLKISYQSLPYYVFTCIYFFVSRYPCHSKSARQGCKHFPQMVFRTRAWSAQENGSQGMIIQYPYSLTSGKCLYCLTRWTIIVAGIVFEMHIAHATLFKISLKWVSGARYAMSGTPAYTCLNKFNRGYRMDFRMAKNYLMYKILI